MRRITTIGTIGLAAALTVAALAFAHPATAADPPPPPTIVAAHSDDPTAGAVGGITTASKSSQVSAQFVMSSAAACSQAMSGDGVTAIPTTASKMPPQSDGWFLQGTKTGMQAGWWVYGTVTVDGVTSTVSECRRIVPGNPTDIALESVTGTTATVSFVPSLGTTSTKVQVLDEDGYVLATHARGATSPVTVDGLTPGTVYWINIIPVNELAGDGDISVATPYLIPPFRNWQALTQQQFADFAGRAPTPEELSEWGTAIIGAATGDDTPIYEHIAGLVDDPNWGPVQAPVTRLYQAYFSRLPDKDGLAYWADRRRGGARAALISQRFATSTEFRRRYGALSDQEFVKRVYQNVLGRSGDPEGIAYWTKKLTTHAQDRGRVMLGFTESSEFIRKMAPRVDLVNIITGMVRRTPSNAEAAYWIPPGATELDATALIEHLFASTQYNDRVS
ncbi:MAG: hypothetical protein JWO77_616 [Ilumatobacteraceae bacterium]|nr:hypothetical protein [Ilumatobacteraceae bacterium]